MDVDVDLRLLRSFVTMAEEGNVGRPARRPSISQPALSKQRPGLDVRLLRGDWTGQTDCLRTGRADLSLVRLPIDERDLEHQVLISEPRVAGLAITHPLAARTALSICEL